MPVVSLQQTTLSIEMANIQQCRQVSCKIYKCTLGTKPASFTLVMPEQFFIKKKIVLKFKRKGFWRSSSHSSQEATEQSG